MKILSYLVLSFLVSAIYGKDEPKINISLSGFPETDYLFFTDLKLDWPLRKNSSYPNLCLSLATGSIGAKTLSMLPNVESLTITGSTIDKIEEGALCSPPKLQSIVLEDNIKFPVLTESILKNCENLKYLELKNTRIEPNALKSMINLGKIVFKEHKNFRLNKEYLQPLQNLETLIIEGSEVEQIESLCLSPRLRSLYLEDNKVLPTLTKSMFENCNHVEYLLLYGITGVNFEVGAFHGLTNVKYVLIQNADINHLTKNHLTDLKTAIRIQLSLCKIRQIDIDAFAGFDNLEDIILSRNELSEFDTDIISFLLKLKSLDLSQNQMTSVDSLRHNTLLDIDLSSNKISKIDAKNIKEHLPNLKYLGIRNNTLSEEDEKILEEELFGVSSTR